MSAVRLVIDFDTGDASPRALRENFIEALRVAIMAAHHEGRVETPLAEELIRALPERGRA